MSESATTVSLEALLGHVDCVRGVARSILRDEHRADDVVQDAFLAVLTRPARGPVRSPRSWLSGIVRHLSLKLARGEGRRARREAAAARPPAGSSVGDPLVREEERSRVAAAVLALDEPYRSTIVLRYFEGLSPREIAGRCAAPVETVRTRHRRGLAKVRERLLDEHDGDRRALALALAPLAGGGRGFRAPVAQAAIGAGIAAVLLLALGTVVLRPEVEGEPVGHGEAELTTANAEGAPRGEDGEVVTSGPAPPDGLVNPGPFDWGPPPPTGEVYGVVTVADGATPAGASVVLTSKDGEDRFRTVTDASGVFRFAHVPPGEWDLAARRDGFAPHRFRFTMGERLGAGPFGVFLSRGGSLLVRILGPGGAPMAGERVEVSGPDRRAAVTDAEGRCRFDLLEAGSYEVRRRSDVGAARRSATIRPDETVEVVFRSDCSLVGRAERTDGGSLAGAIVRLAPRQWLRVGHRSYETRAGKGGGFEIHGIPPGEYRVVVVVDDGESCYSLPLGSVTLRPGEIQRHTVLVPGTFLSGRIIRSDTGAPFSSGGAVIDLEPLEGLTGERMERPENPTAQPDEQGRWSIPGLAPGFYWVQARPLAAGWHAEARVVEIPAGGVLTDVDFSLRRRVVGTLRIRVLEPDGSPAAGLVFSHLVGERTWRALTPREVSSGVFELDLDPGDQVVSVFRKGFWAPNIEATIREGETLSRTSHLSPAKR